MATEQAAQRVGPPTPAAGGLEAPGGERLEGRPPAMVLDTNVVLDWLVFADPSCAPLQHAIEARRFRWIATPRMFEECRQVIERGTLDAWAPDRAKLLAAWRDHCSIVAVPPPASFPAGLRCSDADDQMFIDLAVASRANWLLSKDRAVLRLAARLAPLGVRALSPTAWARRQAPATDNAWGAAPS